MIRKDREVTDPQKIREIILACDCCRIGLADGAHVYIVPLNFGYEEEGDKKIFYFHGAREGRKIDLIRKIRYAGFELDTNHKLKEGTTPCNFSFQFQSVIGEGPICMVEEEEEKKKALQSIMNHYSEVRDWDFTTVMVNAVSLFRLEVKELSCKEHE